MNSIYMPMHKRWYSDEMFSGITKEEILLDDKNLNKYHDFMLHHLQAESDSTNLYNELLKRSPSKDLMKFLSVWHVEEKNHANGYYAMLRILFNENEQDLRQKIEETAYDFTCLEEFLSDEFKLCVLFAYDEYATTLDYRKNTFYSLFGPIAFVNWINLVICDEARHFVNAVKLIHHKHRHRVRETRGVLEKILEVESSLINYQYTFLFDHVESNFMLRFSELKNICAERVYQSIMR